jgi:flagellar biosynthesis/type III secretory pathway chaperone
MRLNNYNMIYIQLSEVFEDENITLSGTKILDKIYPLIENKQILVEVVCEKSQNHQFSWETANIYGYKIVTYFIKKGINPTSIEYIGYGDIGRTKNLGKNIIKIEF